MTDSDKRSFELVSSIEILLVGEFAPAVLNVAGDLFPSAPTPQRKARTVEVFVWLGGCCQTTSFFATDHAERKAVSLQRPQVHCVQSVQRCCSR